MRNEFVKENSKRKKEKVDREEKEKNDYKEYKIDFFPFTYGEQVEN
jgi:hypothetical protein